MGLNSGFHQSAEHPRERASEGYSSAFVRVIRDFNARHLYIGSRHRIAIRQRDSVDRQTFARPSRLTPF